MKEIIKSKINEENVSEYIDRYLQSRSLKKDDLKKREYIKQKENLSQKLKKDRIYQKER